MTRALNFYKTEDNRWYVNLPEWEGAIEELEMVSGADVMLDIYAQGSDLLTLVMSDEMFPDADVLVRIPDCDECPGEFYKVTKLNQVDFDFDIWLCDVTEFVFGRFPEKIYIKR